jgi:RNA polymerase sigma-70 factor (ECF subfamily)
MMKAEAKAAAAPAAGAPDEAALVEALRRGDEEAFAGLVERHQASMVRIAMLYVTRRDVAEEVAQETWLAVLEGIDRFEARSCFKTWLFRILTNHAKTRGARERRMVPLSTLAGGEDEDGPSVDPSRFLGDADRWAGHWASAPTSWGGSPERRLLERELRSAIAAAIAALPASQAEVMTLRDIDGWSADEVCAALGISGGNQRVILHRARSKVRAALERLFPAE